jgi:post-segregation antitoxin (ccd killing protein)
VKKTIYLPDELGERVEAELDLNLSAICQQALEEALERQAALDALGPGIERQAIYVDRLYRMDPGAPAGGEELGRDVTFDGKHIAQDGDKGAYLTGEHRIAVYDGGDCSLMLFDDFEAFEFTFRANPNGATAPLVADAADELGVKRPVHLTI